MVYGQRQDLVPQHTTVQMKGFLSASHHLPQLGILLRGIAASTEAVSTLSVASATIGLPLLTATPRTTCSSTTMAKSFRLAAIARTASQCAVSKNQNSKRLRGHLKYVGIGFDNLPNLCKNVRFGKKCCIFVSKLVYYDSRS